MQPLSTDQVLWAKMLAHEPTRKQRHRHYLWEGVIFYLAMCRRYPKQAAAEIGALVLIFVCIFGMLWISEIAAVIQGWMG
jgi:hypothetical protein